LKKLLQKELLQCGNKQKTSTESCWVVLCVGGKTGGAIWVCLDFLAPPFASRQKVEKQTPEELTQAVKQLQADAGSSPA
jgi:hypothetical protein